MGEQTDTHCQVLPWFLTSRTLASLMPCRPLSPTCPETADRRTLLAHHPSNIGVLPSGLSLGNLILSLCPSNLVQSSFNEATNSCSKVLFPFETAYSVCHQQTWCHVHQPVIKNPKTLLVTPGSEAGIGLLSPPVISFIIPCNWRGRKHYECFY